MKKSLVIATRIVLHTVLLYNHALIYTFELYKLLEYAIVHVYV